MSPLLQTRQAGGVMQWKVFVRTYPYLNNSVKTQSNNAEGSTQGTHLYRTLESGRIGAPEIAYLIRSRPMLLILRNAPKTLLHVCCRPFFSTNTRLSGVGPGRDRLEGVEHVPCSRVSAHTVGSLKLMTLSDGARGKEWASPLLRLCVSKGFPSLCKTPCLLIPGLPAAGGMSPLPAGYFPTS